MADVVKTETDLINRAAVELGISGGTLSQRNYDTIQGVVGPVVAQLSRSGVYDFADLEQIPAEAFLPLAKLVANAAAPSFDMPESPVIKIEQEGALRRIAASPTTGPVRATYY